MSFKQMGVGKRAIHLLVVVVAVLAMANCAGKKPISQVSDVMEKLSESYFTAEETAVTLHDTGILKGAEWDQVVQVRNQLSPIMKMLWQEWKQLPDTQSAVDDFMRSQNYLNAIRMIAQIEAIISNIHAENLQYHAFSAHLEDPNWQLAGEEQ